MIFNAVAIASAAGAVTAAILQARHTILIEYPRTGTFWTPGYAHNVSWLPLEGTGSIALVNGGNSLPLASGVDLSSGRVEVQVPQVNPGSGYAIAITADDGDVSNSGAFQIGSPDVPGPSPSISIGSSTTLVVFPSTSVVTSGVASATSAAGSAASSATSAASSAVSSINESATSAASSIQSSASEALSSITAGASSGLASITSAAGSALSTATSIAGSVTSAAGSAANSATSAAGNAALGLHSMESVKFGAFVSAGVAVIATIAGAALF